jgi:hypothetical protein
MYAKLHLTEKYCVNLKTGVNFKVALKENYAMEITHN